MIVAIDGPAGAGKSTVARALAARLGIGYLNTGSMYRALALLALEHGVDPGDGPALAELARGHAIRLAHDAGGDRVSVDGRDVTAAVRDPSVTRIVSGVSAHRDVRARIVALQREVLREGDWVADGRDIGTVVAPDAQVKVFLTAEPQERARRRHAELTGAGQAVELAEVVRDIAERDRVDSTRRESPLRVAPGARTVDTSGLDVDEVVDRLEGIVREVAPSTR